MTHRLLRSVFDLMNQNVPDLLLRNLETLGHWYIHDCLDWDVSRLEADWWYGLDFFFSHSFMRGRRDELSHEYQSFTVQRLEEVIGNADNLDERLARLRGLSRFLGCDSMVEFKSRHHLGNGNSLTHPKFSEEVAATNELIRLLTTEKVVTVDSSGERSAKKLLLGNDADVMMVLDTLQLVGQLEHGNVYLHVRDLIATEGPRTAFNSLQDLREVGDKIASFVVRDIGLLNPGLVTTDFELAFPVDTWVRRLAADMGCSGRGDEAIKHFFISESRQRQLGPLLVAAGLWYAGYHSLKILLTVYMSWIELPKTIRGLAEPS